MSTSGLVAQAEGAGDRPEVTAVLGRALLVGGVLGAVVVVLQAPLGRVAFAALQGEVAAEAAGQAYFAARVWGAPATLMGFALQGWFNAVVPVIGVWAWQPDGIFIGATRGPALRNAALTACACYLAADLLLRPALGGHGIWLACLVFYLARGATLAIAYPRLERAVMASP
jgi:Na+-driven multidrug efflux pump